MVAHTIVSGLQSSLHLWKSMSKSAKHLRNYMLLILECPPERVKEVRGSRFLEPAKITNILEKSIHGVAVEP